MRPIEEIRDGSRIEMGFNRKTSLLDEKTECGTKKKKKKHVALKLIVAFSPSQRPIFISLDESNI